MFLLVAKTTIRKEVSRRAKVGRASENSDMMKMAQKMMNKKTRQILMRKMKADPMREKKRKSARP